MAKKIENCPSEFIVRMNACYCETIRANANILGVISNLTRVMGNLRNDSDIGVIKDILDNLEITRKKIFGIGKKFESEVTNTRKLEKRNEQ